MVQLKMRAVITPGVPNIVRAQAERVIYHVANRSAEVLREQLSAGVRTGRFHSMLPRQSSALGEYPQEQTGELVRSVQAVKVNASTYAVGFVNIDQDKVLELEFGTPQQGGRAPLAMHMRDFDTANARFEILKSVEPL